MEEEKKEVQPEVEIPFLRKEEVPAAEPKKKKKKPKFYLKTKI